MSVHHSSDEQSCLLQEDPGPPDEENSASCSRDPRRKANEPENVEGDAGLTTENRQTRTDLERDDDKESESSLSDVDMDDKLETSPRSLPPVFAPQSLCKYPSSSEEDDFRTRIPKYRVLPILSGVTIPLCILLDIPALLRAEWSHISTTIASKPMSALLEAGIALSILCATLANVCLVVRFLERRVKTMTMLCILFLSTHDIINTVVLATFRATANDYTYSQAFWMTFCSTIMSLFTNVTLIIDLIRTPDFSRSGSGLTRRQRSLVIITIGLFSYIVLGALVNSLLVDLTFIDGLYFTVVSMATIGFGDIIPQTTSSRIFICVYATLGVINLAFVVGYVRETVLEGLDLGYRERLLVIEERRQTTRLRRRAEKRWKRAIAWRLQQGHAPVWIRGKTDDRTSVWSVLTSCFWRIERRIRSTAGLGRSTQHAHNEPGMQLNLWALSPSQLESAALEAGAPLNTFLPADFYDDYYRHHALPSWTVVHPGYHFHEQSPKLPTRRWFGGMRAILAKLGVAVYKSGGNSVQTASVGSVALGSFGSLESKVDYRADVEDTEKKAYYARITLCWFWLFIFWMGGAALFKAAEGWTYGLAVYFCLVSFTAIGYGDVAPTTPAGRSIFVVWALIGFAIMTFFISVVSEAYTIRYKGILSRHSFKHVVRQYRKRDELERVGCACISTGVEPHSAPERKETCDVKDRVLTADDGITPTIVSATESERQWSLEQLPHQILEEARSMRQYMQLVGDVDGQAETDTVVAEAVWTLIDDVLGGRELTEGTRKDILKDAESRQALMLLGIERSVKALVSISERAIVAIQERDRTTPKLEEKGQGEVDAAP